MLSMLRGNGVPECSCENLAETAMRRVAPINAEKSVLNLPFIKLNKLYTYVFALERPYLGRKTGGYDEFYFMLERNHIQVQPKK